MAVLISQFALIPTLHRAAPEQETAGRITPRDPLTKCRKSHDFESAGRRFVVDGRQSRELVKLRGAKPLIVRGC
jgi:hypothetical protein